VLQVIDRTLTVISVDRSVVESDRENVPQSEHWNSDRLTGSL
jgi:hypothetical protein